MTVNWKRLLGFVPFLLLVLSVAFAVLLSDLPFFVTFEHKTIDWRIRYRDPDPAFGNGIAVVLVDEAAVEEYIYRTPLSRRMLARLVDTLSAADVKLIGLDVVLDKPTTPADDGLLADSIRNSGRTVIVADSQRINEKDNLNLPLAKFMDVALAIGLATFPHDPIDNRVRQSQLSFENVPVLPLSSVLYMVGHGVGVNPKSHLVSPERLDSIELPTDKDGRFFINYQWPSSFAGGKGNIIPTYPASAVLQLNREQLSEWLKDKVVLVGAGYEKNPDVFQTPFYSSRFSYLLMPGVEIHANALATLDQNKTIEAPSGLWSLILLLALCAVLTVIECKLNTGVAGAVFVMLVAGNAVMNLSIFNRTNLALPIVPATIALVFTFVSLAVYRSLTEGGQKRWIRKAFEMYVAPSIVKDLVRRPDRLFLGGEEREMTILFTDIEGFTTISEEMKPTELVCLLNEYLDGMTNIVVANGGTLDKYEGDAIVAFWGAPVEQPDHAMRATKAAIEMAKFSESLSRKLEAAEKPAISTRIGINTGRVIVGNIGSRKHFNYTVMGDNANLASRLESANKLFKTHVMISEATWAYVKDHVLVRELGTIRVIGKARCTRVFELIGYLNEEYPPELMEMLAVYNRAIEKYRVHDWHGALDLFLRAGKLCPEDEPVAIYNKRCAELYLESSDSDGSFVLGSK